jgi:hypothetical protein
MGRLENGTITMTFFIVLLVAYGTSLPGANIQNTINSLFAPFPKVPDTVLAACQQNDLSCQTSNLVLATEHIAVAANYPSILFFDILGRIIGFFSAINTVLFGPQVGVATVPFLTIIFFGIIILPAVYEIFRMARGNASAGTL